MQGKFFSGVRIFCTAVCSVLSLGGNVNTRRMWKPDMGSIFNIKNQWNFLVIGNYYVNYQIYQNLMFLSSSDTKRTLMHLFLFTNFAQRIIYVRRVYATAINFPSIITLVIEKIRRIYATAINFPSIITLVIEKIRRVYATAINFPSIITLVIENLFNFHVWCTGVTFKLRNIFWWFMHVMILWFTDSKHDIRLRFKLTLLKVLMGGKLIAAAYTLRTYWNQSSLGGFVNKNRCINVRLVSEEVKRI